MTEINQNVINAEEVEVNQDLETGIVSVGLGSLMNSGNADMYCSLKAESFESKASIYNALNSPDAKISECINMVLEIRDVIAHEVQLVDQNTGEFTNCLRTILVDKDGKTYQAVSVGVANSLNRIFQIFGEPSTWTKPLKLKPVQKVTNNGTNKVTLLEVVK